MGLRRRTMVIALGASIALALGGGLGIESASAVDQIKARSEHQSGSVERGATRRLNGQGKDLRLRQKLERAQGGRLLSG